VEPAGPTPPLAPLAPPSPPPANGNLHRRTTSTRHTMIQPENAAK